MEIEKRYRIKVADTLPVLQSIPIELPTFVKMLFRAEDWSNWDNHEFKTYEKASEELKMIGFAGTVQTKNSHVKMIEEVIVYKG